eukprot:jgi/Hompol1/2353/HPOL_005962-RA
MVGEPVAQDKQFKVPLETPVRFVKDGSNDAGMRAVAFEQDAPTRRTGSLAGGRKAPYQKEKQDGDVRGSDDLALTSKQDSNGGDKKDKSDSNDNFDLIAVALKTGRDVAIERTPIQLLTFLSPIKNLIIIGESPGVQIGVHPMIDVITGLYSNLSSNPLEHLLSDAEKDNSRKSKAAQDSLIPDTSSQGWKADAHKNLPGFRKLWATFPDAKWYMMIDDDTYVFFENLLDMLNMYDAEKPLYMGSHNVFRGCDNVYRLGDGPGFAHGGSGIVLSRGAMRELMTGIDQCILKYRDCFAGDVRLALCLRDHKIYITDPKTFNRDPPNEQYPFPKDPCYRPVTFHHLLVSQIQKLYNLETELKSRTSRGVTIADLFNDWIPVLPDLIFNGDRRGSDLASITVNSVEACHDRCWDEPACISYVYDGKRCWLKDEIPPPTFRKDYYTGVIRHHY